MMYLIRDSISFCLLHYAEILFNVVNDRPTSSLFWKNVRLQTFKDWPYQSSEVACNPERMASAGFFSIATKEEPDLVECFICTKQLDGWEPTDDPWFVFYVYMLTLISYVSLSSQWILGKNMKIINHLARL